MTKKTRALLLVFALATIASACGYASAAVNELCLVYSGGTWEDASYQRIMKPGANADNIGIGSSKYCYRNDQRSYIGNADNDGADAPPVRVVTDDDVRMLTEYQMYFTLNQDEKTLRQFHENLGVKTKAWTEDGWDQLLKEYFRPMIERAFEATALQFKWRDLYGSEEARKAFASQAIQAVKANLREVIGSGADYFCGPSYQGGDDACGDFTLTVGKPYPENPDIVDAVEAEQTSAARTVAQEQENQRRAAEIEGQRRGVELFGPELYVCMEQTRVAAEKGQPIPPCYAGLSPQPVTPIGG